MRLQQFSKKLSLFSPEITGICPTLWRSKLLRTAVGSSSTWPCSFHTNSVALCWIYVLPSPGLRRGIDASEILPHLTSYLFSLTVDDRWSDIHHQGSRVCCGIEALAPVGMIACQLRNPPPGDDADAARSQFDRQ